VLGPKSLLVWRCCYFMSLWMKLQVTSNFHEMTASLHQHAVGTRNTLLQADCGVRPNGAASLVMVVARALGAAVGSAWVRFESVDEWRKICGWRGGCFRSLLPSHLCGSFGISVGATYVLMCVE
jgi:hypothetical protein